MAEEEEEEVYFKPIPDLDVDGVILEAHSDPRDLVSKKKRNIMPQQLSSTVASLTNLMFDNFNWEINYRRLVRLNQTRLKLKGLDTVSRNPKVNEIKLEHI